MSTPLLDYIESLCDLHRLDRLGLSDDDEGDSIREEMGVPWGALSEDERELACRVSAALFLERIGR